MSAKRNRRAGARWRLLVHEWVGRRPGTPVVYGTSHHVASEPGEDGEWTRHHHLAGCDFDELVVGKFLHIEQMDTGLWWLNVGGLTIHVQADRDGRPTSVTVEGPDDYDGQIPGVRYRLLWNDHVEDFHGREEQP